LRLWIKTRARFPLLLHELAKTGQDKFAVLFDLFVGDVAERIENTPECRRYGRPTCSPYGSMESSFEPNLFTFDSCKMAGDQVILPVSFIGSHIIEISLGQRIHELRDKTGLSLRKMADQIGISSPFLSDIELGRRFPSEEILAKLADTLDVSSDELKQYDTRGPIADLKRLVDSDPKLGFAFRTIVEKIKNGELTARRYNR
jgi:transcriptional regulator with XRE-family HTH domain